ncbi:MAG: ribosomal subunit interface protein [Gammaproteobacteria bacterium GWE2_37_16]|nr:MAG: ribosomal subunit interface protein [Gammaproteobacteria bacterium GWE2_37_16]
MQQIQFTGQNVVITPTLREFTHTKFKRLERYADRITSLHVVFSVDNNKENPQFAEAKIHFPGTEIHASAESEDMYKTIDLLVDKLARQLGKHKGKSDGKKRGQHKILKEQDED